MRQLVRDSRRLFLGSASQLRMVTQIAIVNSLVQSIPSLKNTIINESNDPNRLATLESTVNQSLQELIHLMNWLGVLSGVLVILLLISGIVFYRQFKKWNTKLKDLTEYTHITDLKLKKLEEYTKYPLENITVIQKNRSYLDEWATRIDLSNIHKSLSPRIKLEIEDLAKRIDTLEMLGVSLNSQDYLIKGINAFFNKKNETALEMFGKALEEQPNDPRIWNNRGMVYLELKQFDKALKDYEKAIAINPQFAAAWNNKGIVLCQLKQYEATLKAYQKVTGIKGYYVEAWFNKGMVFTELKKEQEALKAYEKAIKVNPKFAEAWNNKGILLFRLKQPEAALKAYQKALELDPGDPKPLYNCACFYTFKGETATALDYLRKAIDLDAVYKQQAKQDEDLKNLWETSGFKELVN